MRITPVIVLPAALVTACMQAVEPSRAPLPGIPGELGSFDLAVDVALSAGAASRTTQFVGGNGTTGSYNDISTLLVGLFDEGSTTAPAFGFKYSSAFGTSVTSSDVATIAGSSWLSGLQTLVDSDTTADHSVNRRYLVREYTSNLSGLSAISVSFSKLPKATDHSYRAFSAAYDADGTNIGYVSAQIEAASISANSSFTASSLTMTLNKNTFTGTMTQAATLSNVYAEAL